MIDQEKYVATAVALALLSINVFLHLWLMRRTGQVKRKLNNMTAGIVCTSGHCKRIEAERQQ